MIAPSLLLAVQRLLRASLILLLVFAPRLPLALLNLPLSKIRSSAIFCWARNSPTVPPSLWLFFASFCLFFSSSSDLLFNIKS